MSRVVLAMSGGVDSSAAAYLLKEAGHEVIGLFMRSGATEEQTCSTGIGLSLPIVTGKPGHQGCCSAADAADARRVADVLDIPFHALNFKDAFGRIKDYFADEYLAGRTPNPCVMCNNWLKFGKLWEFAQQVGADFIASGHYAQIAGRDAADAALTRGRDPDKDQSYVLFGIRRDLLPKIVFPVGDFEKSVIRENAQKAGLRVFDKPDSQEICFIPDNDYAGFLGVPVPKIAEVRTIQYHESYKGDHSAWARIAMFGLGDITLDLVEPVGGASPWRNHLDRAGEGLQHI